MIAALALAAQLKGTFDLSGAVGTQVRQVDPSPIITVPRLEKIVVADDLFALVNARLTLAEPRWSASLSAAPGLAIQDAELGKYATTQVPWEDFTAGATTNAVLWRDRHLTVTFLQALSYSRLLLTQASLYPYQQGTVGGQPAQLPNVPVSTTTTAGQLGGWDPSLGASVRTSRLTTVFASAGFTYRGGLDPATRGLIPGQYGPRAAVGASEALSPLDTVGLSASGQNLWTQGACPPPRPPTQFCNEQVPLAQLTGNWRRTLSRASSISFMAGAGASVDQLATSNAVVILPVAGVTYAHRFGVPSPEPNEAQNGTPTDTQAEAPTQTSTETPTETETAQPEPPKESPQEETLPEGSRLDDLFGTSALTATAQLAPTIDPLTGFLSTRVSTTATLAKQLSRQVGVAANLAFAQSVPVPHPDPFPLTLVGGGGTARVFLTRQVDLSLTALEQWQFQSVYGSMRSTVGSVTLTAREPTFRFW
ncbi:MAG TPA: hypothetical protein VKU41_11025 [Polyangiaceae bacterium]|nr:hypothetical protein [Polyangiaceae bacterium]